MLLMNILSTPGITPLHLHKERAAHLRRKLKHFSTNIAVCLLCAPLICFHIINTYFLEPGTDEIQADGYLTLLTDMGIDPDTDAKSMIVIQWKFKSTPLGVFKKQQFFTGCQTFGFAVFL